MAVAFVAAGAQTADTAAATVALPAGISTGDILLLCVEECNLPDGTVSNGGGGTWTEVATATTVATLTNRAISRVFWSRYDGSQTAPTWTPSANHFEAVIVAYSGCAASGDPTEGVDTALDESGDANLSFAVTATDTSTAVMVVLVAACKDDSPTFGATWSNASLSSIAVRASVTTTAGNDGSLDIVEGVLAAAGDKGTWTNTLTGTANTAGVSFGLIPASTSANLVIQDAALAVAADNLDLTQVHALAVQDAALGLAADNLTLEVPATNLVIQDAALGLTADEVGLVQQHVLVVQDAAHALSADNLDLVQEQYKVQNLVATGVAGPAVELTWDDVAELTGEGYDIERDGTVIVWFHNTNSYTDTDVVADTTYTYRVRASETVA